MLAKEVTLEPVGFVELQVQLRKLVDSSIQFLVDLLDLILRLGQVAKHSVEGIRQLAKLVFRFDRGSQIRVSVRDRVTDVTQVIHRIEHQVPDDRMQDEECDRNDQHSQGNNDRPDRSRLVMRLLVRHRDFEDAKRKLSWPARKGLHWDRC